MNWTGCRKPGRVSRLHADTGRAVVGVRGFRPAYAVAAALVLALGLWWGARGPAAAYAAVINRGQAVRIVALRDGVVVTIDSSTSLEVAVDPAARHVRVASGRARFAVPRRAGAMFEVTAAAGEITAADGLFDMALTSDGVRVSVITGRASIAVSARDKERAMTLLPGRSARIRDGVAMEARGERPDPTWPQAHVGFDDAPLSAVLALANCSGRPPAPSRTGALRNCGSPAFSICATREGWRERWRRRSISSPSTRPTACC